MKRIHFLAALFLCAFSSLMAEEGPLYTEQGLSPSPVLVEESILSPHEHLNNEHLNVAPPVIKNNDYFFPPEDVIEKPTEETNKFLADFINMLATLGLIIGMIFIIAWFIKRFANTRLEQVNQTSMIKVIEKRILSAKTVVYLLEIQGTGYLISESANGVSSISEFPVITETESEKSKHPANHFEQLL